MKKYILKALIASSPILAAIILYFIKDPFKVLYHYDTYYKSGITTYINPNKDYISTQNFINKYPTFKYDSYIFGGSRSILYHIDQWKKYVDGRSFYHFDGASESLYGIEKKFQFLDSKSIKIKNALFVIDEELLASISNTKELPTIKHPSLSGQSKLDFELYFLKSYLSLDFFPAYLKLLLFNKFTNGEVFLVIKADYNDTLNEVYQTYTDRAMSENIDSFYKSRNGFTVKRTATLRYDSVHLDSARIAMLNNIKNVLIKDSTNYKIVINPLYNQVKMNPADLEILKRIFGAKNVFDFSGINDITNDYHNYYEESHYRPFIARKIMDSIYSKYN